MGPMHLMVFVLLGLTHFSLGKVCPGCIVHYDANDPANQYLIEKLKNLETDTPEGMENEKGAKLVQVLSVSKQIVAGIQYHYVFEARGLTTNKLYDCSLTVFMPPHQGAKEQVYGYKCRVAAENGMPLVGGQVVLDVVNNQKLEELKPLISEKITATQNSKYIMTITKFFKATEQVVSGLLIRATVQVGTTNCQQNEGLNSPCQYQIQDHQVCDVEVMLKPWMKKQEITKVQCKPQPEFCAGCPVEADPTEPNINLLAERTVSDHNAQSLSGEKLTLVKVNKAITQVISGVKYILGFEAKSVSSDESYSCDAVVYSQPWISEEPLVDYFNCTPLKENQQK